ncbi:Intracellular multiplication protein IcmX (plasmid) [Legionella adelaidensis]|uniref:Intracellular multiplication protein IcmX n=1 Tax=Legionella adelaidensis TaxID=45056 RepID=A0A0W0R0E0_9GAMM|nr:type IVB secretion system protein IcmX [Legionella adelaidensis]KTC64514.1 Intracellular multiplication protein IcmX [Legionella adelaidensis]VEH85882.1 Intracellular multiplication protein IcmX [Legionella adelaidensis]
MKNIGRISLSAFLLIAFSPVKGADSGLLTSPTSLQGSAYDEQTSQGIQKLVEYLLNFGTYFGYDLTQAASKNPKTIELINNDFTQVAEHYLINTFFGAVPVNTAAASALAGSNSFPYFIPTQSGQSGLYGALNTLNSFGNTTFSKTPYNQDGTQNGAISVNALIDQQPYQNDPVSQSILNILGTPSASYCMSYDGSQWTPDAKTCPPLTQGAVMENVVGKNYVPGTYDYFSGENVMTYLPQLNSNSLLAPLMYDTNASAPQTNNSNIPTGLQANNEAQIAANFIRYVTDSVNPLQLPQLKDYDSLYVIMNDTTGRYTDLQKEQARETLVGYLNTIRSYSAQMSVAYSNLYSILSKRLPQTKTTGSQQPTSQAMNEFVMATWRLYNPKNQGGKTDDSTEWLQKINNGSEATVQKEIAILLAEINYQLYLNRQQEERILLTDSVALVKSNRATPPNPNLTEQVGTGGQ